LVRVGLLLTPLNIPPPPPFHTSSPTAEFPLKVQLVSVGLLS
jgi:hypothetical protein